MGARLRQIGGRHRPRRAGTADRPAAPLRELGDLALPIGGDAPLQVSRVYQREDGRVVGAVAEYRRPQIAPEVQVQPLIDGSDHERIEGTRRAHLQVVGAEQEARQGEARGRGVLAPGSSSPGG